MKYIDYGKSGTKQSAIVLGCMRIAQLQQKEVDSHIKAVFDVGVNFFDHADIYSGGESETVFGKAIKNEKISRDKIFIQSKTSIRKGYFDMSKEHIIDATEGILSRLGVDYLDSLLLHRPDLLMEPYEVAEAFDILEKSGKVKSFGVSNFNPMQIELLKKCVCQPINVNQLQLSPVFSGMLSQGLEVNMKTENAASRDGSVLDYMRLNDITMQVWSPFLIKLGEDSYIDNDNYAPLNEVLQNIADKFNTTKSTIVAAWILRHPANMQIIAGSTKFSRIKETIDACDIILSREEWYKIYLSAGNILP